MRTKNMNRLVAFISIVLCPLSILLSSCEKKTELETKDWDNTTTFFTSTDEKQSGTYYSPYTGYIGT